MLKLNEQQIFCGKAINEEEILKSIKQLADGKTPRTDGLPTYFCNCFWNDINGLTVSTLYAMENVEFSIEQKRGIITLLHKKKK